MPAKRAQVAKLSFEKTKKPRTKGQILGGIAAALALPRKQVSRVLDALAAMIVQDIKSVGVFSLSGLAKITLVHKPATKARKGINPFTGEPTVFKAKPARKVVKIRALAGIKKAVN
jgi:nucleoid DNA-binding protein